MTITEITNASKIMLGNTEASALYIGNNLIWTASRLPSGYIELPYISSTSSGGQYIDLECKLLENTDDIKIEIKFNLKGNGKDNQGQSTLLGALVESSPYPGFVLRKDASSPTPYVTLTAKWNFTDSLVNSNKYYPSDLSGNINSSNKTYINNIYERTFLLDNIPAAQVNNMNCHLFCALNGSNSPFRFAEADLYYLKLTKGNSVVRDLIPAKKTSDNTIGLYDILNNTFYVSQGTDPFVAGQ